MSRRKGSTKARKGSTKARRERTDREKLQLFVDQVEVLRQTNLSQRGASIEHTILYERGKSAESALTQPDEADVRDHLLTFRQFISPQEDVFLDRIFNICQRRLTSGEVKQNLALAQKDYKEIARHNGIAINLNGTDLTALQITNMWINGKYFHNDLDYQQQLDSLPPLLANPLRFQFVNFVFNVSKIVLYVCNGVALALREGLFQFEDTG